MKHSVVHKTFLAVSLPVAVLAAGFLVAVGFGKADTDRLGEIFFREISASMESKSVINYKDFVDIVFSQPVNPDEVAKSAKLNPDAKIELSWSQENKHLKIKPVEFFTPAEKYNLYLSVSDGILKRSIKQFNFSFAVKDYPKVISVSPSKEESDNVPVSSDVKVVFDKSVNNFNVNFEIAPFNNFDWESDSAKKEFRVFSKDKFQYGTEYSLKITSQVAVDDSNAPQKEIFSGRFKTEAEPVAVVVPDPQPGSVVSTPPDEQAKARIEEGKYIDLNLAKQNLSIFEDGKNLSTFKVSTGKRGMATPTGTFSILAKRGRAWSRKYKLFMPYFMQFTRAGHGIHELPEWPNGHKEGAAHLGIPVSHGCVRLGIGPAKAVYNWADIGTPVVIHY